MNNPRYGSAGHCPRCGQFCGRIRGLFRGGDLVRVEGRCRRHGRVDLSAQEWDGEQFAQEDDR